jgi:hypothetical protein
MNSQLAVSHSGERLSFIELFTDKNLIVEIPIIQRDYAQGRNNQSAVRESFLKALFGYLEAGVSRRDLDFVYGSVSKIDNHAYGELSGNLNRFVPLDGQQRLTTLFLLHWYLAQIAGESVNFKQALSLKGRSRFTYETRRSSAEFCNALINLDLKDDIDSISGVAGKSLSSYIQDRNWFYLSWNNDPTISSMLTMLDAIHEMFSNRADFYPKLINTQQPIITFLFLNLEEFGLTDELYIKMNARGKPLNAFENFKAQLEKRLKSFTESWPDYRLPFRSSAVSGHEYFIHKIDTDWADVFWTYRDNLSGGQDIDSGISNFIAASFANFNLINGNAIHSELWDGGQVRFQPFNEYEQLGCITQQSLIALIKQLDLLQQYHATEFNLRPASDLIPYYKPEAMLKKILTNKANYSERLCFHLFYCLLGQDITDSRLMEWMRVITNLTQNTIFNTTIEYAVALKNIDRLVNQSHSIYELLKGDCEISGFSQDQVIEEKIKAHLIVKSEAWKNAILRLEKHSYFNGQIGFILKFAGISDYYFEHSNLEWGEKDPQFFAHFSKYALHASAVFTSIKDRSSAINYAWERAVLTKGVYCSAASARRLNLLSSRATKNNIDRDHSWKRLLRSMKPDSRWDAKQSYVKAVFDDAMFDPNNVNSSLEEICKKALSDEGINGWRALLVEEPRLFALSNQGFIYHDSEETVIFHESQRNHTHSEMYSKFLDLKISNENINFRPFLRKSYITGKSSEDYCYIKLDIFYIGETNCCLDIWCEDSRYKLRVYTTTENASFEAFDKAIAELANVDGAIVNQASREIDFFADDHFAATTLIKNITRLLREVDDV